MIQKVISGGQTGVDRAALDVALALGLECGGWCPKGRLAEDGTLPCTYPLTETPVSDYSQRTEWNVRDSDGTLVLYRGNLHGGSLLTLDLAQKLGRPNLAVDLLKGGEVTTSQNWTGEFKIAVLNVAGPRESQSLGIYEAAREFLLRLLSPHRSTPR